MNTQNYLAASALAYKNLQEQQKIVGLDGIQYKVIKTLHTQSGYDGYILHREDTNELIVTHRGTLSEKGTRAADILTDLGMAINKANNQYPDAERLTNIAISLSQSEYQGAAILQTGHSLGGALAQLCGYNYGHKTETFNAYGAADLKEKKHGKQNNSALITNHVRATDPVSAASPHLGKVEYYLNYTERAILYGGGYGEGINKAIPNSPWQVAVSGAFMDHSLSNFEKNGLSQQDKKFSNENKRLIMEFRSEFKKEAEKSGKSIQYIQDKINGAIWKSKALLEVSTDSTTSQIHLAQMIVNQEFNEQITSEIHEDQNFLLPLHSTIQTAKAPQSRYDELTVMLHNLLSDTDGSYTQQILVKHSEEVAQFNERSSQKIGQEENYKQELATTQKSHIFQQYEEQQRSLSRSFG
ncbi:lipase family protein [Neisseria arctica]|uniref:lipase family protein n=1 Tax=Neisseria arctica TaxID=1470200 RepID=UPI000699D336|nr:hypothetical protein [Neisseria arctica]UOO86792.1 hypothetical protein LVJ86_00605 [Neisseria arctica]